MYTDCDVCDRAGLLPDGTACPECDGKGTLPRVVIRPDGIFWDDTYWGDDDELLLDDEFDWTECPDCQGVGDDWEGLGDCPTCGGDGGW